MDPKVKEFIEAARAKERIEFERQRNAHLISLGFVKTEKEKRYSNRRSTYFPHYDEETKQYFGEFTVPVDITDEEYEEIKRITKKDVPQKYLANKSAENLLGVLNTILLIVSLISSIVLLTLSLEYGLSGILIAGTVILTSFISWAAIRVLLNISHNLHQIIK